MHVAIVGGARAGPAAPPPALRAAALPAAPARRLHGARRGRGRETELPVPVAVHSSSA